MQDGLVRQRLLEVVDALMREVVVANGDLLMLADALSRVMAKLAQQYRKIGEAWEATGGDPEIAAIFTGTRSLTQEEFDCWLSGVPLGELRGHHQ